MSDEQEEKPLAFGEGFTKYAKGWALMAALMAALLVRYADENARIAAFLWRAARLIIWKE